MGVDVDGQGRIEIFDNRRNLIFAAAAHARGRNLGRKESRLLLLRQGEPRRQRTHICGNADLGT